MKALYLATYLVLSKILPRVNLAKVNKKTTRAFY